MIEKTLTDLATKTREVVEAAKRMGRVRIVRKLRGGEWGGGGKGEEVACYVVSAAEYERLSHAENVSAQDYERLKNTGLE